MTTRWVEVTNSDSGTKWLVDMAWLMSGYSCIWGKGCKGAHHETAGNDSGCCGIGVTVGTKEERKRVRSKAKELRPDEWQEYGTRRLLTIRQKSVQTRLRRLPDGTKAKCIFYNDADFGKPGCALHVAAEARGENYINWKPNACSMVPVIVVWDQVMNAYVLRLIVAGQDWSGLDWWCGSDAAAYQNNQHAYITMRDELENICEHYDKGSWKHIQAKCEAVRGALPMVEGRRVVLRPSQP